MQLNITSAVLQNISAEQATEILKPLALFIVGMVIYAVFIFRFYRFVAHKDIFQLNLAQYNTASLAWLKKTIHLLFYIIEYLLLMPVFAFFWFLVLTVLLAFMAKNQSIDNILLVAIAVVTAIRVTSYYSEDLSKDLAKMLPFALLGVFLVDITYFSTQTTLETLKQITLKLGVIGYYLAFLLLLEIGLRITYALISPFLPEKDDN